MNKFLFFAVLVMAIALLYSCTSDIESAEEVLGKMESSSSEQGVSSGVETDNEPSSSNSNATIYGYCDYGPITEYGGGCYPMTTDDDSFNCAKWGKVVNSCPTSSSSSAIPVIPSSSSVASSSSSVRLSSSSALPSSSSVAPSSSSNLDCAGFVKGTKRLHYGIEKEQFCDERDGQKYVYVAIGTQTWMAENLNYNASGSKCGNNRSLSDDNTASCDIYGRLYNWNTAMNNSASSTANPSGVRGVCPAGWHIPSEAEWNALITFAGGLATAGTKLKAASGWSDGNGTDEYGFSALPGGYGSSGGGFNGVGYDGNWWSASENGSGSAYYRYMMMTYLSVNAYWNDDYNKSYLRSVRCIQD